MSDAVVGFDYPDRGAEEFLDTEYRTWIQIFEDSFPDAELYYPEPEDYL